MREKRNGAKGSERNKRNEKDQVGMKKNENDRGYPIKKVVQTLFGFLFGKLTPFRTFT